MNDVAERLEELRARGLYRRLRDVNGPQGARVLVDGREVLLLCSNNYLGLASHPAVCQAAADAAMRWGTGAGASRLVSGNMSLHRRLEERLADFKRSEAALLFGSGYLANTGTIAALAREGEVVFSDELNHASIVDGCRLARARTFVYRHADPEHLAWGLREAEGAGSLIVTDSVFSMDGDVAPLADLVGVAKRFDCRLVVDEAHATGALGPGGRGAVAEAGLEEEVDVLVGTLSKALGGYGAYVCANREIVELLVNSARPFIFSTALPPTVAAAAIAALDLMRSRPERVERLQRNAALLRSQLAAEGLDPGPSRTQIVPLVVGDPDVALELSRAALRRGVFAQPIRPPSVPPGTSRLRLTVMACHRPAELRVAAGALASAASEVGAEVAPARTGPPAATPVAHEPEPPDFSGTAEVIRIDRPVAERRPAPFDRERELDPAALGVASFDRSGRRRARGLSRFADWDEPAAISWEPRRRAGGSSAPAESDAAIAAEADWPAAPPFAERLALEVPTPEEPAKFPAVDLSDWDGPDTGALDVERAA